MSKSPPQPTEEKPSPNSGNIASFLGGLAFFTIVVGFTIAQNQKLREEISRQIKAVLEVSRDAIQQARLVMVRLDSISQLIKADKSDIIDKQNQTGAEKLLMALSNRITSTQEQPDPTDTEDTTEPPETRQETHSEDYGYFWDTIAEDNKL